MSMFHTLIRSPLALAAALAVAATSLPADARTVVAFAGRPNYPGDATCFSEWFGAVRNNCSGVHRIFTVPLATDSAGYHSVTVSAYGADSDNNVGCRAFGIFRSTTTGVPSYYGGSQRWLATFGQAADISLLPTYVPAGGTLFAACDVKPGGQINLINYTW
jgi:hypothetical protein